MQINQRLLYILSLLFVWGAPLHATGDSPTLSIDDSTLAYNEDQFPYPAIDAAVTVNSEATDSIGIKDFDESSIEFTTDSLDLLADGVKVGDLNRFDARAFGNDDLVVTLNSNATNAIVLAILQQTRFHVNTSEPGTATRTVTVTVTVTVEDTDSDTASDSRLISVTARNDKPVLSTTPTDPDIFYA